MKKERKSNSLIRETSPYLLQHAYNPVEWVAFGDDAFARAKNENKPLLISVGYSACHWCHVMEHESFEDEEVATLMNRNFINVKVDREERSDVDMLYMQAVQLMTGHGGWPLNCFVMPDGRPFYGGTYFPREQWIHVLESLSDLYTNNHQKVEEYATRLTEGIKQTELIVSRGIDSPSISRETLTQSVSKWKQRLDYRFGGPDKAPKFPLPSNYRFLLRYSILEKDNKLLSQVHQTLTSMAFGGIYDQVHGGFARYSTDTLWKVPHFEKMLYDNSQLASLYTESYNLTKNNLYKEIAIDILEFVKKEWMGEKGNFYSAYDADSEGEEGKYYVWTKQELKNILGDHYDVFSRYFEINETGYWENDNYILMRRHSVSQVKGDLNLDEGTLKKTINRCRSLLRKAAENRVKPGLDDKTITAWNALMCTAYAQAYLSFADENYKKIALSSAAFLLTELSANGNALKRTWKNGVARIPGFLDDYAFTAEAMINCYLVSQDEKYLEAARQLTEYSIENFDNPDSVYLFYTGRDAEQLIARTTEVSDNVIPSSNSQTAYNLHTLGVYFGKPDWIRRAEKMLENLSEEIVSYGSGYSNWSCLALQKLFPAREVAIVGNNVDEKIKELYGHGLLNTILAGSAVPSELPLLKDRYVEGKNLIYVCENNACKIPVETVKEALEQLD